MITDFALGLLAATTIALAIIVTAGMMLAAWFVQWLSKYAELRFSKDKKGAVSATVEVRDK